MSRKIDQKRKRILSAYPNWTSWSKPQKALLILRATYGAIPRNSMGEIDPFDPTVATYCSTLNVHPTSFERLFTNGLKEALADFDKTGAFRKGKTRKGQDMKRPTYTEELFSVLMFDSVPSTLIAVQSGSRKSLTNPEQEQLSLWLATDEATEKIRYVDSY